MTNTMKEVMSFIREHDVKFVRLAFCDLQGRQKNISIMPEELEAAFENGVSFDASAIEGFGDITHSDLLLFPDPVTLAVLPWRPAPGLVVRFFCDIKNPDGSAFAGDSRHLLKQVIGWCEEAGYVCKIGAECEFYLFKTDEEGNPTQETLDQGSYFDMSPIDKGENIRREICLCLEEMGLKPETSHHERGPGQNEINFKYADALTCADHIITFKWVVKSIAARNGLFASFMPKPLQREVGSGLHINLSLTQNGLNIFKNKNGEHSKAAESFIQGILEVIPEITLFLNPIVNSYDRLGKDGAPKYVSWSHGNRSQLVRIPAAIEERVRMELRSPDSAINPYLALSLIISAGLKGIGKDAKLMPPTDLDLYHTAKETTGQMEALPVSLREAIDRAEKSDFVKEVIPEEILEKYLTAKKAEAESSLRTGNKEDFSREHYFEFI